MNVEMRLYGQSLRSYRAQTKRVENLKFVLKYYSVFKFISITYAILNMTLNKRYGDEERIDDREIYYSTYQMITGNYDFD
jgi:hypothetical protein